METKERVPSPAESTASDSLSEDRASPVAVRAAAAEKIKEARSHAKHQETHQMEAVVNDAGAAAPVTPTLPVDVKEESRSSEEKKQDQDEMAAWKSQVCKTLDLCTTEGCAQCVPTWNLLLRCPLIPVPPGLEAVQHQ